VAVISVQKKEESSVMKKLLTLLFALCVATSLTFAQAATDKKEETKEPVKTEKKETKKVKKATKKEVKGDKKDDTKKEEKK
jgi:Ni/Co efflux regulator RcnB